MTTTPGPAPAVPALDRLFATLRRSPVRRSRDGSVAGVCAGLADRLGLSVKLVRVVTVVAVVLGPALVLYLAAWLLLPDADGGLRLEQALRQGRTSSIVLLVAALVAIVPDAGVHERTGWLLPLAVFGAIGWFLWHRRSTARATGAGDAGPQFPQVPHGPQDAPGH